MEPTTYAGYPALQVADFGRLPAAGARAFGSHEGNDVMYKVVFSAALAVALITAPMPHLIPTAVAQQQASAPAKDAKTKKEPSAGQIAARERQKKCAAEWKEAKAGGKVEKDTTWPKYWSACNKRLKSAAK
jgi:hypothetical protein